MKQPGMLRAGDTPNDASNQAQTSLCQSIQKIMLAIPASVNTSLAASKKNMDAINEKRRDQARGRAKMDQTPRDMSASEKRRPANLSAIKSKMHYEYRREDDNPN